MIGPHFGLRVNPFPALSDPDSIFESSELIEVVQHFTFARENQDAILLITGEVGTGKTTAIRAIQRTLPQGNPVAVISLGVLTPDELLGELENGFRVHPRKGETRARRLRRLAARFEKSCKAGHWPVLIIDEAHLLPEETLDEIRLLTNFRLAGHPTLQVCLFGQSELAERLKEPRLRPLRQRISLRYEMRPLRREETLAYLHDRIRESGGDAPAAVLTPAAAQAIHELSGGIPREINVVSSQAMMNAYVEGARTVQESHVVTVSEHYGYEGASPVTSAAPEPETPTEPAAPATEVEAETLDETPDERRGMPRLGAFAIRGIGLIVVVLAVVAAMARLGPDGQGRAEPSRPDRPRAPAPEARERAAESPSAALTETVTEPREESTEPREDAPTPAPEPGLGGTTPWSPTRVTSDAPTATKSLAERYPGRLDVRCAEPATVWLDERSLGEAPAVFSGLAPGRYALRVESRDGTIYRDEVQILLGSTTFVTATFP